MGQQGQQGQQRHAVIIKQNGETVKDNKQVEELCGLIFEDMKVKASNFNKSTIINLRKDLDSTETYRTEYNRLDLNVSKVLEGILYIVEFRCHESYIEVLMCKEGQEENITKLKDEGKW